MPGGDVPHKPHAGFYIPDELRLVMCINSGYASNKPLSALGKFQLSPNVKVFSPGLAISTTAVSRSLTFRTTDRPRLYSVK